MVTTSSFEGSYESVTSAVAMNAIMAPANGMNMRIRR